jgi:hypothetical protein
MHSCLLCFANFAYLPLLVCLSLRKVGMLSFSKTLISKATNHWLRCYNMPSAIILVCISSEMEKLTLKQLRNSIGVLEVFRVHGAYDIVIKVKTDTFDLLRYSINKIKESFPKMQNIVTMLIIEHPSSPKTLVTKQ